MSDTEATDNVIPENELARRRFVLEQADEMSEALCIIGETFLGLEGNEIPIADWLPLVVDRLPAPYNERFSQNIDKFGPIAVALMAAIVRGGPFGKTLLASLPVVLGSVVGGGLSKTAEDMIGKIPGYLNADGTPDTGRSDADEDPEDDDDDDVDDDHARDMIVGSDGRWPGDGELAHARMRLTLMRLFQDAPRLQLADGTPDPSQAPALPCTLVLRGSIPPVEGVLSTTPEGGLRLMSVVPNRDNKKVMLEQFFDYSDVVAVCLEREVKASPGSMIIGAS